MAGQLKSETITGVNTTNPKVSEYCYDARGNLAVEAHGGFSGIANCTTFTLASTAMSGSRYWYDDYGNVVNSWDGRGIQTQYIYGSVGGYTNLYPTQIIVAKGTTLERTTTRTYDLQTGLVTSETEPSSVTTTTDYDAAGRSHIISRAGATTQIDYSDANRTVTRSTDVAGPGNRELVQTDKYDTLGRIQTQYLPAGVNVDTKYRTTTGFNYTLATNPYSCGASTHACRAGTLARSWAARVAQAPA